MHGFFIRDLTLMNPSAFPEEDGQHKYDLMFVTGATITDFTRRPFLGLQAAREVQKGLEALLRWGLGLDPDSFRQITSKERTKVYKLPDDDIFITKDDNSVPHLDWIPYGTAAKFGPPRYQVVLTTTVAPALTMPAEDFRFPWCVVENGAVMGLFEHKGWANVFVAGLMKMEEELSK